MTLHIEWFVLQNLAANVMILGAAARAYGRGVRIGRLLGIAFIGAVYAVFSYVIPGSWMSSLPMRATVAFCMAMLLVGMRKGSLRDCLWAWIKATIFIWMATFLFGGIGLSLISLLASQNWSQWALILAFCGGSVLFSVAIRIHDPNFGSASAAVSIEVRGNLFEGVAFVDSGNRLVDPISGFPVAVLSTRATRALFPGGDHFDAGAARELGLRAVPFVSVGSSGILWAVKPEVVTLEGVPVENMMFALAPEGGPFSGKDYDVLLPAGTRVAGRRIHKRKGGTRECGMRY